MISKRNRQCVSTPGLCLRALRLAGRVVCEYSAVLQGLLQFEGFHLFSFDGHLPPFSLVCGVVWFGLVCLCLFVWGGVVCFLLSVFSVAKGGGGVDSREDF